jgi:vacuolar-type H+-ATPase subunit I/STV1
MGEINAVANVVGKGRDDFRLDVLLKAEDVARKVSPMQSKAVRKLADQIKQTMHTFRVLVRKYNENVEVVDPQLKNNQELVEVLNDWEKAWSLGKEHLMDPQKFQHLLSFS